MALTRCSLLFLLIAGVLYLAAILGLFWPSYLALCIALTLALPAAAWAGLFRSMTLGAPQLLSLALGVSLAALFAPRVLTSIHWDVASYGLMKYPEMRHGTIGAYFIFGHLYA